MAIKLIKTDKNGWGEGSSDNGGCYVQMQEAILH